ncbi:hypothetical protein AN641_09705 [Candidatus Epulonipiscioides gigas]|nr:hypothetical protein AN641_09705 [Epulopiscium sp. SCG-C07WGA-EpuloA2]
MELEITQGSFDTSVESLQKFKCPEWFRNAKLGFWSHWGPQCVPMFGDWYARNMYIEGHIQYKYHLEHYGHPSEFGYKDIVPLWKAEKFDPDALVAKYKKAGARYFVACAVHHDNFDVWDSKHHKWNVMNYGPKKDIVGMFKSAADKEGLPFGVTVHHERSYSWFNTNKGCDKEGDKKGVPYDGNNPAYEDFYYPPHEENHMSYPHNPSPEFVQGWYDRVKDVVEKYDVDLLYTDGGVPFGEIGRAAIANLYNHSQKVHNGELTAIYNCKNFTKKDAKRGGLHFHGDYFEGIGVEDLERGVVDDIMENPWQTDTCIGKWFYRVGQEYKTAAYVVKMLCDIVSKNGNLLLNIPLKPDGTLDDIEEKFIEDFGAWMNVNSEAIYDTRPFKVFGEGKKAEKNEFTSHNEKEIEGDAQEIRFTTKPNQIFAICFGWADEFVIKSIDEAIEINKISMLGVDEILKFKQTPEGLVVKAPTCKPCEIAYTLKIETYN